MSGWFEHQDCQGRQRNGHALCLAVEWNGIGEDRARVADVSATVNGGVAIDHFPVTAGTRNADTVTLPRDRREIGGDDHDVVRVFGNAVVGENACLIVVRLDPAEAFLLEVDFVESGFGTDKLG